jgi:hypothetical protein
MHIPYRRIPETSVYQVGLSEARIIFKPGFRAALLFGMTLKRLSIKPTYGVCLNNKLVAMSPRRGLSLKMLAEGFFVAALRASHHFVSGMTPADLFIKVH